MSDYGDLSRLPDDPAYWTELEARVLAHAGPLPGLADERTEWWTPFVVHSWRLGIAAAAAIVAALLLVPPRAQPASAVPLLPLPQEDPVLNTFLEAATPPPLGALVVGARPDGDS